MGVLKLEHAFCEKLRILRSLELALGVYYCQVQQKLLPTVGRLSSRSKFIKAQTLFKKTKMNYIDVLHSHGPEK